ncbi:hypothetical protein MIND_01147800 [Mycena indigotica]|uniref:Protein ZIP4 homolog n=1 Tax=Mycena indigotica TaxID=2126181 RepID=A0A8H6S7E4_9AGAR|nr:uncharacterized protein MIND_01147800 [Mycena indigotica]KAF7293678.1 hypothetical protein MIND_01147800 [Mycena indigotica]
MASRKKKSGPTLQQAFDSIRDLLIATKPRIDNADSAARPMLIENLRQIGSLAESFAEQRGQNASGWIHLADELDQEGVNLWNISGLVQKSPTSTASGSGRMSLVAALRLAGFRLIETGLELKPEIENLIHILQLASKTGSTLSEAGSGEVTSVLSSAARVSLSSSGDAVRIHSPMLQYEELLRNAEDPDSTHHVDRVCATLVYLAARMEAAWKEGNQSVASFMAQKITDDEQRLSVLPSPDQERLACKFHEIGKAILKTHIGSAGSDGDDSGAVDAVAWLQKAFSIAERIGAEETSGSKASLRARFRFITILRTMARAYFITGSYDRAEAVLDELIPAVDALADSRSGRSEHQELRWLRLAVVKKRKASDTTLLDAFKSIIDHMTFSESNITDILQDLRTLNHQHHGVIVAQVHLYCLQQALRWDDTTEGVNRLLLSLIVHCSKDEDHQRAMETMESVLTTAHATDFKLLDVPSTACLTLLWQYGDRHFAAKRFGPAADWFLIGTHALFQTSCPASAAKCFRKAALCHIEHKEHARAAAVIRKCPVGLGHGEASTHYLLFIAAVHQGLEDEAIRAVREMVKAVDFDRKMLLLATQISHESEMKTVLITVLEALLKTLKVEKNNGGETVVEAMALVRCIIRLVGKLLAEPTANKSVVFPRRSIIDETNLGLAQTTPHGNLNIPLPNRVLAQDALTEKAISLVIKDVSWLWRMAYNCAVQCCAEWEEGNHERVSELFEVARDLLATYCEAALDVPADVSNYMHLINATFSGVSGRVFAARLSATDGTIDANRLRENAARVSAAKTSISAIVNKNLLTERQDITRAEYFLHVLRVFEAEIWTQLKEWQHLSRIVVDVVDSGPLAVGTYEAIADILWAESDCPIDVLLVGLEAILRASLDHSSLSVEKFSRWLRAVCTIMLARNSSQDRVKAIVFVEQAVTVIADHHQDDQAYPIDERNWLLGTAYNTGFECLEGSMLDEAKRWFETAALLCKFVPGGEERAEKIVETFTHLLAHYHSNAA